MIYRVFGNNKRVKGGIKKEKYALSRLAHGLAEQLC